MYMTLINNKNVEHSSQFKEKIKLVLSFNYLLVLLY